MTLHWRKHWLMRYPADVAGYILYTIRVQPPWRWYYCISFHRVAMILRRARVILEKDN